MVLLPQENMNIIRRLDPPRANRRRRHRTKLLHQNLRSSQPMCRKHPINLAIPDARALQRQGLLVEFRADRVRLRVALAYRLAGDGEWLALDDVDGLVLADRRGRGGRLDGLLLVIGGLRLEPEVAHGDLDS